MCGEGCGVCVCAWGTGPVSVGGGAPLPWRRTSPLTGTCRAGLKSGRWGGREGPRETGGWLVMWRPGGSRAPYLLLNSTFYTFAPPPQPMGRLTSVCVDTHMRGPAIITRENRPVLHHTCIHLNSSWKRSFYRSIVEGMGHVRSVLAAHPPPLTLQYAEVLNDWTPRRLLSAALSQALYTHSVHAISNVPHLHMARSRMEFS